METTMTVKDVLKDVLTILNNISIPMSQINEIGMPIAKAINGIQVCVDAMETDEAQKANMEAEKEGAVSE